MTRPSMNPEYGGMAVYIWRPVTKLSHSHIQPTYVGKAGIGSIEAHGSRWPIDIIDSA